VLDTNLMLPAAYRYTLEIEPAGFAWEFLRRNPGYRRTFASGLDPADHAADDAVRGWGLRFPADPDRRADEEAVFWHPDDFRSVITLKPAPTDWEAAPTSLSDWPKDIVLRDADDGLHVLVRHKNASHQMRVIDPLPLPHSLVALIPLDQSAPQRAGAVACFWQAIRPKRPLKPNHRLGRRQRLIAILRALDGHLAGESYRAIAEAVLGARRVAAYPWKTSPARDSVIRLTRSGLSIMGGGYRDLLQACQPR
jgi:hypothetical protein